MKSFIITLICLILGPTMLFRSCKQIRQRSSATEWPTVSGEVYGNDVTKIYKGGKWNRHVYRPMVNYRYEVNGKIYHGVRVELANEAISSESEAIRMIQRYPNHTTVTVHHDPEDPESSCLEIGSSTGDWSGMVAGLLLFGFGGYLARQLWQKLYSDDLQATLRHNG